MNRNYLKLFIISIVVLLLAGGILLLKKKKFPTMAGTSNAHEVYRALTQETQWLNTSRALQPQDLEGRIILVDFWTFCCINCMHVFPDLHKLENEFGKDLTVIGVHSAKFQNEKDTESIRSAVLRYDVEHPVVNDADFNIWNSFGVNSWPTLVLINPEGRVEQVYSGEGHLEDLRQDISRIKKEYAGKLNTQALPIALERSKVTASELKFPGKLEYAPDLDLLFISDSSNDRILITKLYGDLFDEIGKKREKGKANGDFQTARFNRPQGLLYRDHQLYVADTENHLLRKVDLDKKVVTTLAGTGEQGFERTAQNATALTTALSSPWDLAFFPTKDEITIAMAGNHQLWVYNIPKQTLSVLAGNGRESIDDGAYPNNSLSQPSGLSVYQGKLYFVDSETSSLRVLEDGKIKTLIGSGLFNFGFRDGTKETALLQHPLGVFADALGIYIADSYNHSIRRYDPASGKLDTLAGNGKSGKTDGAFVSGQFNEPNDILKIGDKFYVADTNNHQIRVLDPATKVTSVLPIKIPQKEKTEELASHLPNLKLTPEVNVKAGENIPIKIRLPEDWKINEQAPSGFKLFKVQGDEINLISSFGKEEVLKKEFQFPPLEKDAEYRLQGTFYYCREGKEALCFLQSRDQKIVARVDGVGELEIQVEVPNSN